MPIDVNGNGQIDPNENFYDNLRIFLKAVNDGTYPSPLRPHFFIEKLLFFLIESTVITEPPIKIIAENNIARINKTPM